MIITKAELASAISQCSLNAPHLVPLLQAAYRDEVSLAAVPRGKATPLNALDRARAPAVVLVGDDVADGHDPGPVGWPGLPRVLRWARFALINATGGCSVHYCAGVELARLHRKLLFVETGTSRSRDWLAMCRTAHVPAIELRPVNGGSQPAAPNRSSLH